MRLFAKLIMPLSLSLFPSSMKVRSERNMPDRSSGHEFSTASERMAVVRCRPASAYQCAG